jgi:predicted DCC family thiol-disulfide oxidoreductase YuxK
MTTGPFTIIFDGHCPLCVREVRFMRKLDRGRGRLAMLNLAAPDFQPSAYGLTMDAVTGAIHGIEADGSIVTGVEVFRRAYAAVGWGWLLAWTRWPLVRPVADAAYRWFARNRYRLTGRTDPCAAGRCRV